VLVAEAVLERQELGNLEVSAVRKPVTTIAMPAASAAAITSSSFIEPPGWIAAVTPARIPSSSPSGKGKKASDAITEPAARSPARRTAICTASTRDICPAPTPMAAQSLKRTIAFDFTCFTAVHASSSCSHSFSVGCRCDTTLHDARSKPARSHSWTRKPPATVRTS